MKPQANKISPEQREQALLAMGLAGKDEAVCELKLNGQAISNEMRDELLRKCAANEYVELTLDVIAYEQKDGVSNRNFVRVSDKAMKQLATSAKGKPFLFDHNQSDSSAVCGMIESATLETAADGTAQIRQNVKLTAPKAVDMALRGLMKTVSISWRATDTVECSACKTPVFTDCYHFPGDKVRKMLTTEGKEIFVRDRKNGTDRVEWVYNGVETLETSPVPVPAVPTARIDGIRASLSADADETVDILPDNIPENKTMELEALKAQLNRQTQIAALNDAEKAYFRRLGATEQDAFLAQAPSQRAELLKPVYTAKNGTVYTGADDPRLVQMAKDNDAQASRFEEQLSIERAKGLMARATTELAHLSGTPEQRAALLGAIESIENAETRAAVLASIKEVDTKQSRHFVRQGGGGAQKPEIAGDPEAKLEQLAQSLADKESISFEQAYEKVCNSPEGQKLYDAMHNASRGN
jgi:hypothetical protein